MLNIILLVNAVLIVIALVLAWFTFYKTAWLVMIIAVVLIVYGYLQRDK